LGSKVAPAAILATNTSLGRKSGRGFYAYRGGSVRPGSYPVSMITCALCRRNMLLGEAFGHWRADGAGSEQVVCRLCEENAERRGWARLDRPPERRTTLGSTRHARKVA
jgi:3-hydroxyacyl-CoA dehydrogenase